jgi:hypothetical protein
VHCDVGGGYPESESGLSKLALEWMLDEAVAHGLIIHPPKLQEVLGQEGGRYVKPDAKAMMHESLRKWWHLAEFVPKRHFDWQTGQAHRRMSLYRRRTIPPKSLVHFSAFERGDDYRKRLPPDVIWVCKPGDAPLQDTSPKEQS